MSRIMWGVETDPVTIIRGKLIELNQPSAEDWRNLTVVSAKTMPVERKPSSAHQNTKEEV